MSHWNPNIKFDYENWCQQQIAKRAKAALDARDAAFAEKHADTPLNELAHYLRRQAELLRRTPGPCEVDGGAFIEQRFGSWEAACKAAYLCPPVRLPKLINTARYNREKKVQEPLVIAEHEEKKKLKRQKKPSAAMSWLRSRPRSAGRRKKRRKSLNNFASRTALRRCVSHRQAWGKFAGFPHATPQKIQATPAF